MCATERAYSTEAYGNAIYGTVQGKTRLWWRFAKTYNITSYLSVRNTFKGAFSLRASTRDAR